MDKYLFIIIFTILAFSSQANAEFYEYMDENGNVVITDNAGNIPKNKRSKVKTIKEQQNTQLISNGKCHIPLPTGQLEIVFPIRNLQIEIADANRPYYMLKDTNSGLNVSFNFEPATKCHSSENCRDYFAAKLKRLYPNRVDWSMSNIDSIFISENMDGPLFPGKDLKQHHMNAHFVKDGVWIDVHLSKIKYVDNDRQHFVDFIQSITIQ